MSEFIAINVVVGDRTYRLRLKKEDEGTVRNIMKMLNDKIVEYKTNFSGKDMQDYISMVLLWLSTEQTKQNDYILLLQEINDRSAQLTDSIVEILDPKTEN